jgi:Cyclic nucleotide-binding domain
LPALRGGPLCGTRSRGFPTRSNQKTENIGMDDLILKLFGPGIAVEMLTGYLKDFVYANITLANMFGVLGSAFYAGTLLMRTIVPLRIAAIISDLFFITYGVLAGSIAIFVFYGFLLPVNVFRLYQMVNLVKRARISAQGELSMDWLKPFMTRRKYLAGDAAFCKGDRADEMFLIVTGKFLVKELAIERTPGHMLGELGFLSSDNRRTQTVECIEDGEVLTITYAKLLELYFQIPEFGYYFLRLSSERLLENVAHLEAIIARHDAGQPKSDAAKGEMQHGLC